MSQEVMRNESEPSGGQKPHTHSDECWQILPRDGLLKLITHGSVLIAFVIIPALRRFLRGNPELRERRDLACGARGWR